MKADIRPDGRWELLRVLGAVADDPVTARSVGPAVGLSLTDNAEHTDVFVLNCPPYASVYLGPEGVLGGEGTDRAAGFWRAIGVIPPVEPDHLAALLGLYARLGEAAEDARKPGTATALARFQAVLLHEHLRPWLPAYLDAVNDLVAPTLTRWARLTRRALSTEIHARPRATRLPLALRAAPAAIGHGGRLHDLVDALTTP